MAIDMAPFTDNRVRQAMRLIADRPAMLEQVLSGYGHVANDLFSPFDACFTSSLAQREQDIDKAKSLLKAAGMDGATFDLHTTNGAAGMVDSATVFASQAKDAGITINVHNDPNYYGKQYLHLPFSVDFWGTRNYLPQVSNSMLPAGPPFKAPYNETHWPPTSGPDRTTSASTSRPAPRRTPARSATSSTRCRPSNSTTGATSSPSSTTSSTPTARRCPGSLPGGRPRT